MKYLTYDAFVNKYASYIPLEHQIKFKVELMELILMERDRAVKASLNLYIAGQSKKPENKI